MKVTALFALWGVALVLSGCGSTAPRQYAQRGPVWVLPAVPAPPATLDASSNTPPTSVTAPTAVPIAPTNASGPVIQTNLPRPVTNVLSLADIREMAAKGLGEQTILNVLRASRVIYTLTAKDVAELQAAKVSVVVIDYLLSTPLRYKDDLLRTRAYYYYAPVYPGYWHWSHHDFHHDVHYYDSHRSSGHGSRIWDWHH